MIEVQGILETISPMHISAPENASYDSKTGKTVTGNVKGMMPLTRTQRQYVLQRLEKLEEMESKEASTSSVPVAIIPANSLRGRLRRQGAKIIKDILQARGELLSLDAYHTLMCGAPNGYPDNATATVKEYQQATAHPYFGVFGGGPRMIPSKLRMDTCYPVNPITTEAGIIPNIFHRHETETRNTQVVTFRRVDDATAFSDPQVFDIVENANNAIETWRDLIRADDTDIDEEDKTVFRGVRSWTAHEIIKPGTTFYFSASLNSNNEAQKGLFLKAIENLMNLQNLGGWSRNGYGRYNVSDMTLIETGLDGQIIRSSLLTKDRDGYRLDTTVDNINSYLMALDEALENVTAAEIEELSTHVGGKVEERKEKIYKARKKAAAK